MEKFGPIRGALLDQDQRQFGRYVVTRARAPLHGRAQRSRATAERADALRAGRPLGGGQLARGHGSSQFDDAGSVQCAGPLRALNVALQFSEISGQSRADGWFRSARCQEQQRSERGARGKSFESSAHAELQLTLLDDSVCAASERADAAISFRRRAAAATKPSNNG